MKNMNIGEACTGFNNRGDCNSGYRNSGYYNSGNYNSGDSNSGNCNSGYYNSGNYNSGDFNSGNYNSRNYNSGDYNSGDYNSGDYNSGDYNSGDYNSGYYNSGDYNSGVFNTIETKIYIFNKLSNLTYREWRHCKAKKILDNMPHKKLTWVESKDMTNEEKLKNPEHEITGGFLKSMETLDRQNWWDNLTEENKKEVTSLPNFNNKIFGEITGIEV